MGIEREQIGIQRKYKEVGMEQGVSEVDMWDDKADDEEQLF